MVAWFDGMNLFEQVLATLPFFYSLTTVPLSLFFFTCHSLLFNQFKVRDCSSEAGSEMSHQIGGGCTSLCLSFSDCRCDELITFTELSGTSTPPILAARLEQSLTRED